VSWLYVFIELKEVITMIVFKKRSLVSSILNLWPPNKKRENENTKAAIKYLIDHPETPCVVGDYFIPNGYGKNESISMLLFGVDV